MTNLNIQQGQNIEIVSSEIIKKLYEAALSVPTPSEGEQDDAYMSGNLQVDKTYRTYVSYLTARFSDLHINVTGDYYIPFEDPNVLSVLMANNISSDGIGITEGDASTANLGTIFKNNTTITSFNGFKYFTRANTSPVNEMFSGCTNLSSIDLSETTALSNREFYGTAITGTLDLTNVTTLSTDALLGSNITGLIVPNTIQNINFIGCLGLRTITADMSLWTKVPSFQQSPNVQPFVIYQPLVTTIDVTGMFGTGWNAGGEKTGPSTWTQLYWPAATSAFNASWYYRSSNDCGGLFIWSRYYLKTIDVVYFKDIQNIDYYALQYCKIKALVINNTTVPTIQNHDRHSSTITSNETSFINLNAETIIYVPDSAVTTFQTAWPTHTIQGISTLNNGVYYETEADWTVAGKPVGLIGEYLGLNSTELASFVSTHNLTKWVNSNT